jgi:hypothetical protein
MSGEMNWLPLVTLFGMFSVFGISKIGENELCRVNRERDHIDELAATAQRPLRR